MIEQSSNPMDSQTQVRARGRTTNVLALADDLERQAKRSQTVIGESQAFQRAVQAAKMVASTSATVLLTGATGTGKGVMAEVIHHSSSQRNGPFIKVNCAGLPPGLVESTLFGHEKGSFTGAQRTRAGLFEAAAGGTIFLVEIGDLPFHDQGTLLRVLEDRELQRVGSTKTIGIDARVIAATNRCLESRAEKGQFRRDLFFRLNVFPIQLPTLADRAGDVAALSQYFLEKYSHQLGKRIDAIPPATLAAFERYNWPGNVRELKTVIERSVIMTVGSTLNTDLEYFRNTQPETKPTEGGTLNENSREFIHKTLERTAWRIEGPRGAAKILGLKPSTLRSRIKKLQIERPEPAECVTGHQVFAG